MTLLPRGLTDSRYGRIHVCEISAHDLKEPFAWDGQGDVARGSIKEPESKLVLQLPDQNAQTGRRYEESFSRPGKALMLGGQNKCAKLS